MILGLEFPPISHVTEWPTFLGDGPLGVNKVILFMWISVGLVFGLMYLAGRQQALVPRGIQNVAESTVEFVQDNIILQTIGPSGLGFTPFLLTLFTFVLTCNIWGLVPGVQMPVNARIALPMFMAVLVWVIYHTVGIMHQGPITYFKNIMFMPNVPKAMYILLTPIELVTKLITQPLSLAVRLFANMLAGHLLLVSFAVITQALLEATIIGAALPLALLIFLSGFELLVALLQAYIFTILAAVYIGDAMHPAH
ncbi:MAG: F0F1 ATP synthase subunit A [Acidimicrobiales bacterium]